MKGIKGFRVWQILYPIGIYYVVSSLAYFGLQFIIGTGTDTYMLRQLLCAAVTIPFTFSFYTQPVPSRPYGRNTGPGGRKGCLGKKQVCSGLLSVLAAAAVGMAVNNVLAVTPLMERSTGFQNANAAFFGGTVLYELLGSCLIIPIAEELLFRGVVYGRLRLYYGVRAALLGSALLFGAFHVNLVQFLYAFLLGLLLAYLVECTGYFYPAVLGHIAANTAAVVRAHTDILQVSDHVTGSGIAVTLALGVLGAAAVVLLKKNNSDTI